MTHGRAVPILSDPRSRPLFVSCLSASGGVTTCRSLERAAFGRGIPVAPDPYASHLTPGAYCGVYRPPTMTVQLNGASRLSGLDVAIGLKADLLHRIGTNDPSRWPKHVLRFVAALERSRLRDNTALVVLLTELREQLRLLLGIEPSRGESGVSAPTVSAAEAWAALSRREILMRFKEDILGVLLPAAAHPMSPSVQRAKRIIDERYADPLTLERLAATVGCSKRQLASMFRQEIAMTPHEYLTRVRLRRALRFIRDGEKIEVASLLVGYQSKKNFYRHFKTRIGVTPRAYRASLFHIPRK